LTPPSHRRRDMTKSQTPRADAMLHEFQFSHHIGVTEFIDLARQLERELAVAKAELHNSRMEQVGLKASISQLNIILKQSEEKK